MSWSFEVFKANLQVCYLYRAEQAECKFILLNSAGVQWAREKTVTTCNYLGYLHQNRPNTMNAPYPQGHLKHLIGRYYSISQTGTRSVPHHLVPGSIISTNDHRPCRVEAYINGENYDILREQDVKFKGTSKKNPQQHFHSSKITG